jgi:hypothetical protein
MPGRGHLLEIVYLSETRIDEVVARQDERADIGMSEYVVRGFMGQDPDDSILSGI